MKPASCDRRRWLKSAASLAMLAPFNKIFPSAFHAGLSSKAPVNDPEVQPTMNQTEPIASSWLEPQIGFQLAHEQFKVPELVEFGIAADQAGFDLLAVSDHFQPWQENEGHSGQAWVTMSAVGQRTKRIRMGTTVTCPTFRYNPAVVAEAFASLSLLTPGRIFLGVGSGEALNEEAATGSWPRWTERSERLVEATGIIRKLWTGEKVNHAGELQGQRSPLRSADASHSSNDGRQWAQGNAALRPICGRTNYRSQDLERAQGRISEGSIWCR
jgi:Luciferase-like monooxygenase